LEGQSGTVRADGVERNVDSQASYDLGGAVAIVTGGGRGIGAAIARGLSAAGASLMLAGRGAPALEAVAGEICPCWISRRSIGIGYSIPTAEERSS